MHYSVYLVDLKIAVDAIMSNTNFKIFLGGGACPQTPLERATLQLGVALTTIIIVIFNIEEINTQLSGSHLLSC